MNKLVSIVLPTYNGERFIKESIDSVLAQTYSNWELIIVNDCSKDNTLSIVNDYAKNDSRIKVISNSSNQNLPVSLNIGFREAKGEYYTWTSDDNIFKPNAIEYMVNYLDNHSDVDLLSCSFDIINEDGSFYTNFRNLDSRNILQLAEYCNVGACFMYTRDIALKVGEYDKNMFCAEDYDYWCRIALIGNIKYIDENLYKYRNNSKSLTATRQKTIKAKCLNIRLKYADKIMDKLDLTKSKRAYLFSSYFRESCKFAWLMKLLIVSPFMIFNAIINKISFKHKLKKMLSATDKKACLWGASLFIEDFIKKHKIDNKNILGIIDGNPSRHGQNICGYMIYPPEKLDELKPDVVICTIKNNHNSVYLSIQGKLADKYPNIYLEEDIF